MKVTSVKPHAVQRLVKRACGEGGEIPTETLSAYFEIKKLVHVYEMTDISVTAGDMECIVLPFVKAMSDMFPAMYVLIIQDNDKPLESSLEAIGRMYQLASFHHSFTSAEIGAPRVYVGIYNEDVQRLCSLDTAVDLAMKNRS